MLRDVRLAETELVGEPADLARPVGQPMEDLEPARVGEGPQDLGLQDGDLVHGSQHRYMRICASVPRVTPATVHSTRVPDRWGLGASANATDGPVQPVGRGRCFGWRCDMTAHPITAGESRFEAQEHRDLALGLTHIEEIIRRAPELGSEGLWARLHDTLRWLDREVRPHMAWEDRWLLSAARRDRRHTVGDEVRSHGTPPDRGG